MIDTTDWTYHDFLAFSLIYVAELDYQISDAEYEFLSQRLSSTDINRFKNLIENHPDTELFEVFGAFQKKFLTTPEEEALVRRDIEAVFAVEHHHEQFEKEALKMIEKML